MGEKVKQNIRINLQEKSGYGFNHYIEAQDDEKQNSNPTPVLKR